MVRFSYQENHMNTNIIRNEMKNFLEKYSTKGRQNCGKRSKRTFLFSIDKGVSPQYNPITSKTYDHLKSFF